MGRGLLRAAVGATVALTVLLALSLGSAACGSVTGAASGATSNGATASSEQRASAKDPAPSFSGVTLDGKIITLDQYRGKPLLLVYMTDT